MDPTFPSRQRLVVVEAATTAGSGMRVDWTLWAWLDAAHPDVVAVEVHSACSVTPAPPRARSQRPRSRCTFGHDAAIAAHAAAVASLASPPPYTSDAGSDPRVYFITAIGGRRARLEHMLWMHHRNAVEFGERTGKGHGRPKEYAQAGT